MSSWLPSLSTSLKLKVTAEPTDETASQFLDRGSLGCLLRPVAAASLAADILRGSSSPSSSSSSSTSSTSSSSITSSTSSSSSSTTSSSSYSAGSDSQWPASCE